MFLIAEIGQAHEGSLGIAHSYIDALAGTGVDAVKFQMHIAEAESSSFEPFRVKFSYEDETRYDYWKRMEFTPEQWQGLKEHCEEKGLEFICSPFSLAAVNALEKLKVKRYKIGSGEISNLLMLNHIAETGKEVILSSGMSSYGEIDAAVEVFKKSGNKLSILQCTTSYPTKAEDWGLNVIPALKERFGLPVGFSDHSGDIFACLAATAVGAEILEFHVVFDKQMFGPDAKASLTIAECKKLAEGAKQIYTSLHHPADKDNTQRFTELKGMFEKSLAVNKDLPAGHAISLADLESKKPSGQGYPAADYRSVLGKKLRSPLNKWDFLKDTNLEN
jgi:N,N'-diacetyllegionaminate synthase